MNHHVEKNERYAVIDLDEEKLDSAVAPELKGLFTTLNAEGFRHLVFNVEKVKHADSSGLSAILIANRLCQDQGGSFVLTGLTDMVSKLIKISKLEDLIEQANTRQEGIDRVIMNQIEQDLESGEEE